jgi:hypothetical protein
MSGIWERFNDIATPEEVLDAKAQFAPLEEGVYKMTLLEFKPDSNKDGLPMLKGKFRTEENKIVFYNQMLANLSNPKMTAVNISEAVKFFEGMFGEEIAFESVQQLADLAFRAGGRAEDDFNGLPAIEAELIGKEYVISVTYGAKDVEHKFPKLKIEGFAEPF